MWKCGAISASARPINLLCRIRCTVWSYLFLSLSFFHHFSFMFWTNLMFVSLLALLTQILFNIKTLCAYVFYQMNVSIKKPLKSYTNAVQTVFCQINQTVIERDNNNFLLVPKPPAYAQHSRFQFHLTIICSWIITLICVQKKVLRCVSV